MLYSGKTREQLVLELDSAREEISRLNNISKTLSHLASIIDNSDDAIIGKTIEGVITSWNKSAEKIYQYSEVEAVGKSISMLVPPDRTDEIPDILSRIKTGERVDHFETVRQKRDGTLVNVSLTISPIVDQDFNVIGASTIARDITERKRSEELRMDIERIVQHDLRSPACAAVILSQLLADSPGILDSDRDLLVKLRNSGQRMLDTLNQSLDLYKINAGEYQAALKIFDMVALTQEISDSLLLLPISQGKNVDIRLSHSSCPSDSMCSVLADFNLTRLSLQNLIQNAIEASQGEDKVLIELFCNGACKIAIRNNGVVPKEIRDRFFEKYVTAGKKFGTGIGTYSAKLMVEAQGGTIQMETSDERNETVVTIILPERLAESN